MCVWARCGSGRTLCHWLGSPIQLSNCLSSCHDVNSYVMPWSNDGKKERITNGKFKRKWMKSPATNTLSRNISLKHSDPSICAPLCWFCVVVVVVSDCSMCVFGRCDLCSFITFCDDQLSMLRFSSMPLRPSPSHCLLYLKVSRVGELNDLQIVASVKSNIKRFCNERYRVSFGNSKLL